MNTGTNRQLITVLAAISMSSLGGCLTSEGSGSEPVNAANPVQNNAPTISGNPQSAVLMGDSYSFTPTANDVDGDTLTFSIQNLPAWASFNSASGEVSGVPSLADIGVYTNITISVSDGSDARSLQAYSITVSQAALGSMSLSWTPPTENLDGSVLDDLAGYRIYYGLAIGDYPSEVEINNPGLASYVVENLAPNTYYVVATSFNAAGIESAYSNVIMKQVD